MKQDRMASIRPHERSWKWHSALRNVVKGYSLVNLVSFLRYSYSYRWLTVASHPPCCRHCEPGGLHLRCVLWGLRDASAGASKMRPSLKQWLNKNYGSWVFPSETPCYFRLENVDISGLVCFPLGAPCILIVCSLHVLLFLIFFSCLYHSFSSVNVSPPFIFVCKSQSTHFF